MVMIPNHVRVLLMIRGLVAVEDRTFAGRPIYARWGPTPDRGRGDPGPNPGRKTGASSSGFTASDRRQVPASASYIYRDCYYIILVITLPVGIH